ncbi:MAG: hypothetical protein OEX02_18545, partial [Cyclobacteriaceae bacterium]|nr:hypothetical protein [Cyclobacteriaceae bacterium]
QFYFPEKQTNMGRKHKHPKTDEQTISLKDYQNQLSRDDFSKLSVRQSTKGQVIARFHKKDIWVGVDKYNRTIIRLTLLIRIDKDGTVKYSFSNTNDLSIEQLAKRQAQRVFVERVFEEGKN